MGAVVPRFSWREPKSPITGPAKQAHCVVDRPPPSPILDETVQTPVRYSLHHSSPILCVAFRTRLTRFGNASVSSSHTTVDESGSAHPTETHTIRVSMRSGCLARFDIREGDAPRCGAPPISDSALQLGSIWALPLFTKVAERWQGHTPLCP